MLVKDYILISHPAEIKQIYCPIKDILLYWDETVTSAADNNKKRQFKEIFHQIKLENWIWETCENYYFFFGM